MSSDVFNVLVAVAVDTQMKIETVVGIAVVDITPSQSEFTLNLGGLFACEKCKTWTYTKDDYCDVCIAEQKDGNNERVQ